MSDDVRDAIAGFFVGVLIGFVIVILIAVVAVLS
jgi:hypothetical protein